MKTENLLDKDQQDLCMRIFSHDETLVYATMGSGKTVCYLTALNWLLEDKVFKRALIVAPLKPANEVWKAEHSGWEHLKHLRVEVATGTPAKRTAAIESDSDVVVINIENLVWFLKKYGKTHNFDMLCIDELSKFGSNSAKVVKELRKHIKTFKHRVGLTGTPVHESLDRLFSQVLLLDGGVRYGRNRDKFLREYFYPTDYEERNWAIKPNKETAFFDKLDGLLYSMPDYTHTLPPVKETSVKFDLTDESMDRYNFLASRYYVRIGDTANYDEDGLLIDDDNVVVAESAAVVSGKLEQLTSGFVYDGDDVVVFSNEREKAFKRLINSLAGRKIIVAYSYEYEREAICLALNGDYTTIKTDGAVDDWNAGKINHLLMHPKSGGHGLNLAKGGHTIVLYSPIWSNDTFKQLIGRVWRRGQTHACEVFCLHCNDTVDDVKALRIGDKETFDRLLREHIKKRGI